MSHTAENSIPLLSRGMFAILVAQFLSALADNAILIAAIAIVKQQGLANLVPMLQESFVVPFILLAPFVGQIADAFPKRKVMLAANIIKLTGAMMMVAGMNPLTAYAVIGIGAAVYSPAKYGILSQIFGPEALVKANSMMEGSTIVAILLGVLMGGWLADHSLQMAFTGVVTAYALAAVLTVFIPAVKAEREGASMNPAHHIAEFGKSMKQLFNNRDARFSLIGTSVFWGSGTTLRMMLFAWVPAALMMNDNQTPANLMGAVSIGIVMGAAGAGIWISLKNVNRSLIGGLALGPVILALAFVSNIQWAYAVMVLIGLCGGWLVVPLNALLQECGHESIGAGNALAVQNFAENLSMLLLVGVYSAAISAKVEIKLITIGFGLLLLVAMGSLWLLRKRGPTENPVLENS